MTKKILILGVGHNTAVYIELAELLGYSISGLSHYQNDRTGTTFCNIPIVGCNEELLAKDDLSEYCFALSMGDSVIRRSLSSEIQKRGGVIPKMIHPSASVSKYAHLEEGVIVHSNATVQANAQISQSSVISFNSGVTHDAVVEEGVYIAGKSIVGAYTQVKTNAFVGMGSVLISGKVKVVGENAVIGAGSVVTRSVEPNTIVAGNPARVVGKTNSEENKSTK